MSFGPNTMVGDVKCESIAITDDTILENVERFRVNVNTFDNSLVDVTDPSIATIHIIDHTDGKYN